MKRRLLIAKALIHKPEVIILDEPTAGVDIELRHSLYAFLEELHRDGKTIILTTHYLEEAERLCDRIIMIKEGKKIADENKEALMAKFATKQSVEVMVKETFSCSTLSEYQCRIEKNKLFIEFDKSELSSVITALTRSDVFLETLVINQPKLEDVFLSLTTTSGGN
jgi:ABC-2 type transport system ATP-binding protein